MKAKERFRRLAQSVAAKDLPYRLVFVTYGIDRAPEWVQKCFRREYLLEKLRIKGRGQNPND